MSWRGIVRRQRDEGETGSRKPRETAFSHDHAHVYVLFLRERRRRQGRTRLAEAGGSVDRRFSAAEFMRRDSPFRLSASAPSGGFPLGERL